MLALDERAHDSPSGWTSDAARQAIGIEQYQHDSADPHWGFASWNDFFTRRFRDGARPVAASEDDNVIAAACESTPFSIRTGVKRRDEVWLKTQPRRGVVCGADANELTP